MTENGISRLYYSIGEVSRQLGLDQHVLRYWETEFRQLAPRKNRTGKRLYRENDIQLLKRIKWLLYVEKHTIEGARQKLKSAHSEVEAEIQDQGDRKLRDSLRETRQGLIELKEILNR